MTTELSAEDKEFLQKCEEELKHRFTENDEEFMKVFNLEHSPPPIVENWWVSNHSGRRNDRRFRRRDQDRRDNYDNRGYRDYNMRDDDRGYGYQRRHRPY